MDKYKRALERLARAARWRLGDVVPGEGIFLGRLTSKKHLQNDFNLFASPEPLGAWCSYREVSAIMIGMENWHGHKGEFYGTEGDLQQALKNGSYKGGWIMPTLPMMRRAFRIASSVFPKLPTGYWTISPVPSLPLFRQTFNTDQKAAWCSVENSNGCWPVRLVKVQS